MVDIEGGPGAIKPRLVDPSDLLDEVDAILWEADAATLAFSYVSQGAERILGYQQDAWLNDPDFWPSILHPEDRDLTIRFCRSMTDRGLDHEFRYRAIAADGRVVWLRDNVKVEVDGSGRPLMLRGVMFDITERQDINARRDATERLLREKEKQLAEAQEVAELGSWDWDLESDNLSWSDQLFRLYGVDPGGFSPTYEAFLSLLSPSERPEIEELIARCISSGEDMTYDYSLPPRDGKPRVGHATGRWIGRNDDNRGHFVGTVQDVTDQRRAQKLLAESEAKFRAIFEHAGVGIITTTPAWTILDINAAASALLGYTADELRGHTPLMFTHPEDVSFSESLMAEIDGGKRESVSVEKRYICKDGRTIWGALTVSVVSDPSDEPLVLVAMIQDITQRKILLEEMTSSRGELARKTEEMASLSRRLVELQEAERRRIALDLHDEVGQILTGLKLTLEAHSETDGTVVAATMPLVEDLVSLVRDMTLALRPPMLDDLGLIPTLEWYIGRYTSTTGIQVDLQQDLHDRRLGSEIETAVYRVVQEALTNVAKHSEATSAVVTIQNVDRCLNLAIIDQGIGYHERVDGISTGMIGMRERLLALGGTFSVEAPADGGTRVAGVIPLREANSKGRRLA